MGKLTEAVNRYLSEAEIDRCAGFGWAGSSGGSMSSWAPGPESFLSRDNHNPVPDFDQAEEGLKEDNGGPGDGLPETSPNVLIVKDSPPEDE